MRIGEHAGHASRVLWQVRTLLGFALLICAVALVFLGPGTAQGQNPRWIPVLQGLLQKYKGCILERYETQQDMRNRGLSAGLSGLSSTHGLQDRDVVTCVAGNQCSRASRETMYAVLEAQANRGDPTNFETNLKQMIPADCFQCQKHQEWHTKHVHCTMDCGGNNGLVQGPCFEGCKAGVDITKLVNDIINDIRSALQGLQGVGQALSSPTVESTDARGYHYVETSQPWKQMCTAFPCFAELQWPDYASYSFNDTIDGHPVVIQLWKGYCEKFLGLQNFPGGIGAEVGIYRREPGRGRPTSLPFLPPSLAAQILKPAANLTDNDLWWAYPELNPEISFKLINPKTNQVFFETGKERTYWLNRWMNETSYLKYKQDQGAGRTPPLTHEVDYQLIYTINGKVYKTW
jgi:hypothetical protein